MRVPLAGRPSPELAATSQGPAGGRCTFNTVGVLSLLWCVCLCCDLHVSLLPRLVGFPALLCQLRSGNRMPRRKLRFRLVALTGDSAQSGRRLHNSSSSNATYPIDNMRISVDDSEPRDRLFCEDIQIKMQILMSRIDVETAFPCHGQRQQRQMSHIEFTRWHQGSNFHTLARNFSGGGPVQRVELGLKRGLWVMDSVFFFLL